MTTHYPTGLEDSTSFEELTAKSYYAPDESKGSTLGGLLGGAMSKGLDLLAEWGKGELTRKQTKDDARTEQKVTAAKTQNWSKLLLTIGLVIGGIVLVYIAAKKLF